MPVRGVRFCKVYDIARRGWGVNVFGRNAHNVLRDLSHAGAWRSMCDCTVWQQVRTRLQQLCMRKSGARLVCLSTCC